MSAPLGPMAAIGLVARREIVTRLRSKALFIGLAVVIVFMAGYGVLFTFLAGQASSSSLALDGQARQLRPALTAAADRAGLQLTITDATPATEQRIRDGNGPDALLTGGPGSYRLVSLDEPGGTLDSVVNRAVRDQAVSSALRGAGADPARIERASTVTTTTLAPEDPLRLQRVAIAFAVGFLLYLSLLTTGTAIAQGVVEEKTSRVVELLLSTVRPIHLLAGKILGLAVVGLVQILLLGLVAGGGALAAGLLTVPSAVVLGALGSALLWYLVGYFLYACVFAAAGAIVSRQEELGAVVAPVTILLIVPFLLATTIAVDDPRNSLITTLSFVPFLSQTLMPIRAALGVAPLWQVLVSLVLALAAIAVMVWLAARIYANSVLRTGARVKLSEALRGSTGARS